MDELIQELAARIKRLIQGSTKNQLLNVKLTQNKTQLTREKDILQAKHKMAISQIETIVSRLKSIEKSND